MKDVKKSSGNVFVDMGHPDPDTALFKSELAIQIDKIIEERGLTQTQAASILDIDQARVSDIRRGRLAKFSTDYLFRVLNALGLDVSIRIKAKPKSRGQAHVSVSGT